MVAEVRSLFRLLAYSCITTVTVASKWRNQVAKLSAHGEEIARFINCVTGTEYAFMEDRWIMVKLAKGEKWRRFKRTTKIGEAVVIRDVLLKKGFVDVNGRSKNLAGNGGQSITNQNAPAAKR